MFIILLQDFLAEKSCNRIANIIWLQDFLGDFNFLPWNLTKNPIFLGWKTTKNEPILPWILTMFKRNSTRRNDSPD